MKKQGFPLRCKVFAEKAPFSIEIYEEAGFSVLLIEYSLEALKFDNYFIDIFFVKL
jgi:hypothetical protein